MWSLSPSLDASRVSAASSATFLSMASSPLANSAATYEPAASAPLRAAMVSPNRRSIVVSIIFAVSLAIYFFRILEHWVHRHPITVVQPVEKAAMPAGVTGDTADLFNLDQHHILVAI